MFPFYNNATSPLIPFAPFGPFGMRRRTQVPTIDNRGIYELCTTGIVENQEEDNESVDYGVNPKVWKALPNECVVVWKVRHPVSQTGASLPVNVVVPTGGSSSTVTSSNSTAGSKKVSVVDNKGTKAEGRDVTVPTGNAGDEQSTYTTEHWVYINKCADTFRLMGVTAQNSPARTTPTTPDTPAS